MNYYNEWDAKIAAWLRELIKRGLIPMGEVDERSIKDVQPADLKGYTQCHFFAGIGGWPLALQLAGWDVDRLVWTGSCPCQPFSCAGKGKGFEDDRHLSPEFVRLIDQCRPPEVFGEQVASAIGKGWLDDLFDNLEAKDYACGASVFRSCSVGAPSERKRLYWVASDSKRTRGARLVERQDTRIARQRYWGGKEDLLRIFDMPTERGDMWPQPIIRRLDARIPSRVASLHGYGNAIDPRAGAIFIQAYEECLT